MMSAVRATDSLACSVCARNAPMPNDMVPVGTSRLADGSPVCAGHAVAAMIAGQTVTRIPS